MKLEELMKTITPLPHLAGVTQTTHDAIYKARAANVLPGLVSELHRIRDCVGESDVESLDRVLAIAEFAASDY